MLFRSHGQTFRVSTGPTDFTHSFLPLGTAEDASVDASITSQSLAYATYEIQTVTIYSTQVGGNLTAGDVSTSGFRLTFGDETTGTTTAGGAAGCLLWDGSAEALEAELEMLVTVDDVKVEREKVVVASAGEGVKYTITFIGDLVRGNVPELVVTDLAVDGCSDAEDAADRYVFSADASWAATTYQTPFVPMWKMQTTAPIAHDAEAADVEAALETLGQCCDVDVEREVYRNGFAWYVTFGASRDASESITYSPLSAMGYNGESLTALVQPRLNVVPVQHVVVDAPLSGVPKIGRASCRERV